MKINYQLALEAELSRITKMGSTPRLLLHACCAPCSSAVLMQLGRILVALVLGYAPATCVGFITTDVLSVIFAVLLVWISGRLDGILEDQKDYLKRIQEEQEKEARRMYP